MSLFEKSIECIILKNFPTLVYLMENLNLKDELLNYYIC